MMQMLKYCYGNEIFFDFLNCLTQKNLLKMKFIARDLLLFIFIVVSDLFKFYGNKIFFDFAKHLTQKNLLKMKFMQEIFYYLYL